MADLMDRSESVGCADRWAVGGLWVGCADVQCHCFELETKTDHRSGILEGLLVLIGQTGVRVRNVVCHLLVS